MKRKDPKNGLSKLVETIVEAMDDVKAEQIRILDLRDLENAICDYFVVCQANSDTQVKAISNRIEQKAREDLNEKPWHVEGRDTGEWVLMDYVSCAAHIFKPESRKFYDLEGLWGDAKIIEAAETI